MAQPAPPPPVQIRHPVEAQALQHKRDMAILAAENAALCRQLRDAGIEPVSKSGDEWYALFQQAAHVLRTAQLALVELGSSKEMLRDWA
jgi:hypothetical protein